MEAVSTQLSAISKIVLNQRVLADPAMAGLKSPSGNLVFMAGQQLKCIKSHKLCMHGHALISYQELFVISDKSQL
jgi:hypothetical protein